jgi:uncharacterized membrane protein
MVRDISNPINMKKQLLLLPFFALISTKVIACITCNRLVQEAIFDSTFYPNLFTMLSAFIVMTIVVILLSVISSRRYNNFLAQNPGKQFYSPVPVTTASIVLGIGIGGFIDGIVLHQILQWHEMISNKMPPVTLVAKSVNMFWDGIFHLFTLLVTIVGIVLLWNALRRNDTDHSGSLLLGGLLIGWAVFNIGEGIIDHHILKLHNVREITTNPAAWNFGFLGLSVILLGIGFAIVRKHQVQHRTTAI